MPKSSPGQQNGHDGRLKPHSLDKEVREPVNERLAWRAGAYMVCLPSTIEYRTDMEYTGHTLSRKEDGWVLTMKVRKGSKHYVAFQHGPWPGACFRFFAHSLVTGLVRWREDRFRNGT